MKQVEAGDASQGSQDSAIEKLARRPQFYTRDAISRTWRITESRAMQKLASSRDSYRQTRYWLADRDGITLFAAAAEAASNGEEQTQTSSENGPQITRSRTIEICGLEQPHVGEFKAVLRPRHSRIHRLVLFGAQASLQQDRGHTLPNRTRTASVRPVDD